MPINQPQKDGQLVKEGYVRHLDHSSHFNDRGIHTKGAHNLGACTIERALMGTDLKRFNLELSISDQAKGDDEVIVLYPWQWKYQSPKRDYKLSNNARCIYVKENIDLWTRDIGFVNPARPFKFTYEPRRYLSVADSRFVDGQFRKFLTGLGIMPANTPGFMGNATYLSNDQLIEDGGNVVDNHYGKAIISERFFENSNFSSIKPRQKLIQTLEQSINSSVLFIPDPGDTTGHADGVVSFIEPDTLLIADYPNTASYTTLKNLVNKTFPDLKIVRMPCPESNISAWKGRSAVGVYVNILYTDSSVYVPTFKKPANDKNAIDIVKANVKSGRKVKAVDTARLSRLGGSVRCMTMQIKMSHPIARKLYDASVPCATSKGTGFDAIRAFTLFLGNAVLVYVLS